MKDKKKCKINKEELDGIAGGYTIAGKEGSWVITGKTSDGEDYIGVAVTREEAWDMVKKNQLKEDKCDVKAEFSPTADGFTIFNM